MKIFVVDSGAMGKEILRPFTQAGYIEKAHWKASTEDKLLKVVKMLKERWFAAGNSTESLKLDFLSAISDA